MPVGVVDRDLGYQDFLDAMMQIAKQPHVVVGIRQGGKRPQGDTYEEGFTVAEVATVHEFGTKDGRVPERSFLRGTLDANRTALEAEMEGLVGAAVDGSQPLQQGLGLLGERVVGLAQKRIAENIPPPLKPATLARKTRAGKVGNVALIDTGRLRASIDHEVRMGPAETEEGEG
jgi:hypothetical protein